VSPDDPEDGIHRHLKCRWTKASDLYETAPSAMRLRELETLTEIAREKNLIVVTMTAT